MSLVEAECEPGCRLSWATTIDGDNTGSTVSQGWVVTPTDNGWYVLTEETQQGPWFLEQLGCKHHDGLYSYHQNWVEALARAAESKVESAP